MSTSETNSAAGSTPAVVRWIGDWPARVLAVISCGFLFFMMIFTFADVMGRYLFNSPLPAAYEIISLVMPGVIFCALPLTNRQEGHVTIDLFDALIPRAAKLIQSVLVNLFAAGVIAFIAWRLAWRSFDHYRFFGVTDELYLSLWPFSAIMSVLAAIAALAFIANVIEALATHRAHETHMGSST